MALQPWGGKVSATLPTGSVPAATALSATLTLDTSYAPPAFGAINFLLAVGYVPPDLDAVDFSIGPVVPLGPQALYRTYGLRYSRGTPRNAATTRSGWASVSGRDVNRTLGWTDAAPRHASTRSAWGNVPVKDATQRAGWNASQPYDPAPLLSLWRGTGAVDRIRVLGWRPAPRRVDGYVQAPWLATFPRDRINAVPWDLAKLPAHIVDPPSRLVGPEFAGPSHAAAATALNGILVPATVPAGDAINATLPYNIIYDPPDVLRTLLNFTLAPDGPGTADFVLRGLPSYTVPPALNVVQTLPSAYTPPSGDAVRQRLGGRPFVDVFNPLPSVSVRSDPRPVHVPWGENFARQRTLTVPWGRGGSYGGRDPIVTLPWVGEPPDQVIIPPALRVYVVLNTVSVVRLPGGEPIDVASVDLASNVDSWSWSVSIELANPAHIDLLKPDANGPKIVEITMNGYVWTAVIEGRDHSRGFANKTVRVVGRSQTALLAAPYAPARSFVQTNVRTGHQLADDELSNTGFTLSYTAVDWQVPAGAWYYQDLTPVEVLTRIAEASGGVLQSHPTDKQFKIAPRFPVSPWAWTTTTPDLVLMPDWVTAESARQQSKPLYNAVIVTGEQQGVTGRITRAGSAGDLYAGQVVDQLILDNTVAIERGRNVLSDRGEQELVELEIPLFGPGQITAGQTGLFLPLNLVQYQDTVPWLGLSVGVTISSRRAGRNNAELEINQRVSLERHLSDAN